jgi:membrane-associated protease RseP (regulator of RpoE activity)
LDFSPYIIDPDLERIIEAEFTVDNRYIEFNTPTFTVSPRGGVYQPTAVKESFKRVARGFREKGYLPFLRREGGHLVIRILNKVPSGKPRYTLNILLLAATMATVGYDGYLRSSIRIFTVELMPGIPVYVNVLLFLASIMGIFGLHELAHRAIAMKEGVEASMPYFIPAPPGIGGTFGAVITQKEPPANRDALFDLGLSGPLAGFITTIVVTIFGIAISFVVSISTLSRWATLYSEVSFESIPMPPLMDFLIPIIRPIAGTQVLIFHPVAFAAWVGCLVTFLNILPIWQLDGGHVSRAVLGAKKHRILSFIGLGVMVLTGFYMMALMLAIFMFRSREDVPLLDDVSPLSSGRKIFSLVYFAILGLTFIVFLPLF